MRVLERFPQLFSGMLARLLERRKSEDLQHIAARLDGQTCFAALHLESSRSVGVNADVPAPMASTVKIALAISVLARADAGSLDLDAMIDIEPRHLRPGHGLIASRLGAPGVSFSMRQLLRLMLVESDNTATDVLFEVVGGPQTVLDRVSALGIEEMRVDRTILQMMSDRRWTEPADAASSYDLAEWKARAANLTARQLESAGRAFLEDGRDTTTANAMVRLLASVHAGEALSARSTAELMRCMAAYATGGSRIRAGLPQGASVANKTGTLVGVVSADVGIVTLPGGDHIALSIYVVGSANNAAEQDRVIADLARAACAHFGSSGDSLVSLRPDAPSSSLRRGPA